MPLFTCRICKEPNLLYLDLHWVGNFPDRCKKCWNKYNVEYRAKRKAEGKRLNRVHNVKMYGLTNDQYRQLVELHLGGCAICKQPCEDRNNLSVDHNHKTGKVRGLLCIKCNWILGRVEEDEDILVTMIDYIKNDGVLPINNQHIYTVTPEANIRRS